jgi:hypothetical protein
MDSTNGTSTVFWDHLDEENALACRPHGPTEFTDVCKYVSQYLASGYFLLAIYLLYLSASEYKLASDCRVHRTDDILAVLKANWATRFQTSIRVSHTSRERTAPHRRALHMSKATVVSSTACFAMALQLVLNGGHTIYTPNDHRGALGDVSSCVYILAHSYNSLLQIRSAESLRAMIDDEHSSASPNGAWSLSGLVEFVHLKGTPMILLVTFVLLKLGVIARSSAVATQLLLLGLWASRSFHTMVTRRVYAMNRVADLQVRYVLWSFCICFCYRCVFIPTLRPLFNCVRIEYYIQVSRWLRAMCSCCTRRLQIEQSR